MKYLIPAILFLFDSGRRCTRVVCSSVLSSITEIVYLSPFFRSFLDSIRNKKGQIYDLLFYFT